MPIRAISPWVWVVLIALCFVANVGFAYAHVEGGGILIAVIGCAVAGLSGAGHSETRSELVTLRKSMHPPREPTASNPGAFPPESPTGSHNLGPPS